MLSPQLDKQEGWDIKTEPAGGDGMSNSHWMDKFCRNAATLLGDKFRIKPGNPEDIWDFYENSEGRNRVAELSEMYGSNYVLMQVSLEALPPGLSAGSTGFGSSGTNWADILPRLMKSRHQQ